MYSYTYDAETGGLLLNSTPLGFSKEPRPVYYQELDILGFDKYWNYEKQDEYPYMWAEANTYYYRGKKVAQLKGGSLYCAPEIVVLEEPESQDMPLLPIDIPEMVRRNHEFMEGFVQETIREVYNTWKEYQHKVDVFYVAFSGGKDSIVTLDIVQKALPHDAFMVLFGDTQMEFIDTYGVVQRIKEQCADQGIKFVTAKSDKSPEETWTQIGPPAQKLRWCCSVHKTAPQILTLRKLTSNPHFRGMGMMGVRGDESAMRSKYKKLNFGTKHRGQYDFYPILDWNTAELYLYIYENNLIINKTYKMGNTRAGCLVCPMATEKSLWMRNTLYEHLDDKQHSTALFNNLILSQTIACEMTPAKQREFMEVGAWKSRHNGEKLAKPLEYYEDAEQGGVQTITIHKVSSDWKQWIKTIGPVLFDRDGLFRILFRETWFSVYYSQAENGYEFSIPLGDKSKDTILFIAAMKDIMRKSAYCIFCKVCEANCPNGFIHMNNGSIEIDDRCVHCMQCHKVSSSSCWVAASHIKPKGEKRMSVDRYKTLGVQYSWVGDYLSLGDDFWEQCSLGTMQIAPLKAFLSDANVSQKGKITTTGEIIAKLGADSEAAWALMMCNAVYTAEFNWWITNTEIGRTYTKDDLLAKLTADVASEKSRKNIVDAFKVIFHSNTILGKEIGMGVCDCTEKGRSLILNSISRTSWSSPDPRVVLYCLYRFATECDGYYEFRLSYLMDDTEIRDGISPSQLFGINRDTMQRILEGLSIDYPQLIHAAFNLDLESISLSERRKIAEPGAKKVFDEKYSESKNDYIERIVKMIFA